MHDVIQIAPGVWTFWQPEVEPISNARSVARRNPTPGQTGKLLGKCVPAVRACHTAQRITRSNLDVPGAAIQIALHITTHMCYVSMTATNMPYLACMRLGRHQKMRR